MEEAEAEVEMKWLWCSQACVAAARLPSSSIMVPTLEPILRVLSAALRDAPSYCM